MHASAIKPLILQLARFGGVGLAATTVHALVYAGLIERAAVAPQAANLFAFAIALFVSFFGHSRWTFAKQPRAIGGRDAAIRFNKFVATSLIGLALNALCIYLIVDLAGLHYRYSLLTIIFVVPALIFVIAKYWVFGPLEKEK